MFHIGIKASKHIEGFQNNNEEEGGGWAGQRQGVAPTTGLVTFALRHAFNLSQEKCNGD